MRQLEYENSNLKIELFFFINSIKLILNQNIIILLILNTKYNKNGFNFQKDKSKKQELLNKFKDFIQYKMRNNNRC